MPAPGTKPSANANPTSPTLGSMPPGSSPRAAAPRGAPALRAERLKKRQAGCLVRVGLGRRVHAFVEDIALRRAHRLDAVVRLALGDAHAPARLVDAPRGVEQVALPERVFQAAAGQPARRLDAVVGGVRPRLAARRP